MRTLPALAACLLASTAALAQVRQPAQITTTPSATPQTFDVLDKSGAWSRFGATDPSTHAWTGVGAAYDADQFGAKGDFVNDDGIAIAAAMQGASLRGGGTVVLASHPYWNKAQALIVPSNVRLACAGHLDLMPGGPLDYSNYPCTIYQGPTATLENRSGAMESVGVLADFIHFTPLSMAATRIQIRDYIAQMANYPVGISIGVAALNDNTGSRGRFSNILVGGFQQCISQDFKAAQVVYRDILMDCNGTLAGAGGGLRIDNSYDDNFLNNLEFWPYLTTHRPPALTPWIISALADNGSGAWRVTTSTANDLDATDWIWVNPGVNAMGASGYWKVAPIDGTHFDLIGSAVAPSTTGNTTTGLTYIPVASIANLQPGMTVSDGGVNIPAGATIGAVWRTPGKPAISLDQTHAALATATGVALTFGSSAYTSGGKVEWDGIFRLGDGFGLAKSDGTQGAGLFSFGSAVGLNLDRTIGGTFVNVQYDQDPTVPHYANQNLTSIGVRFGTAAYRNVVAGSMITTASVGILNLNAVNTPTTNTVIGMRTASSSSSSIRFTTVEHSGIGGLSLIGVGGEAGGNVLFDGAAQQPVLSGTTFGFSRSYGTGTTAAWRLADVGFGSSLPEQNVPSRLSATQLTATAPTAAVINLYSANQALDEKYWRLYGFGYLCMQSVNDAYTVPVNALCFNRTGNVPTASFSVPLNGLSGSFSGSVAASGVTSNGSSATFAFKPVGGAQPADQKYWDFFESTSGNGDIVMRSLNDAFSQAVNFVTYTRGAGSGGNSTLTGAKVTIAPPVTLSGTPTSAGAGGLYVCIDSVGVLYKKATCP